MKLNYRDMLEALAVQARRALATAKPNPEEAFRCNEFQRLHHMSEKFLGELRAECEESVQWFEKLKRHDVLYDTHKKTAVFAITDYDPDEGGICVEWNEDGKLMVTLIPKNMLKRDMIKWNP